MNIKIITIILLLFISGRIFSKERVFLPQLDRSNAVIDYFSSPDEARKYLKTNKKPSDYFRAGYYYYYYSFTLFNDEKKNKICIGPVHCDHHGVYGVGTAHTWCASS